MALLGACALSTLFTTVAASAPDSAWRALLQRDLVELAGERYVHDEVAQCWLTVGTPSSFSVGRQVSAPASLMSRDVFVSLATQLIARNRAALAELLAPGISATAALGAVHCRPIALNADAADFRVTVTMRAEDIEVETMDQRSLNKATDHIPWKDLLNLEHE
ncbi:MAG: hypothetical protein ACU85V_01600 [Gammaproteobacteria bacterium]